MKHLKPEIMILSAMKDGYTYEDNMKRHELLKNMLFDIKAAFQEVEGVYKGQRELSVMVVLNNEVTKKVVSKFAFVNFGQESVLISDNNRDSKLHYGNGQMESIGQLTQIPEHQALRLDNYTYVPSTQTYWSCL
jgi:hypothetical protein